MFPGCQRWVSNDPRAPWEQTQWFGNIQALAFVGRLLPEDLNSCIPHNVTLNQLVRVVVVYIECRPQRMHEPFNSLALEAMHEAFPCR
jgi:hypothetical protein